MPRHNYKNQLTFCALVFFLSAANTNAESIKPFAIGNYNPLPQMFGLPLYSHPELLQPQSHKAMLLYDKSNFYSVSKSGSEHLVFDGESSHTTFVYHENINKTLQWGITIPHVGLDGGSLDSFILDWHDWFGLPQSGRDIAPLNVLKVYYQRNGVTEFNLVNSSSGIGDVRFNFSRQLQSTPEYLDFIDVISISLKLPTGDAKKLHGSGAVDVAVWGAGAADIKLFDFKGNAFHAVGISLNGKGDMLANMQRPIVAFGQIGAGLFVNPSLLFKAQIDTHTPLYKDSGLSQLTGYAVQLTAGGSVYINRNVKLDIGVSEDLYIDVSPDVTFHIGFDATF